MSTIENLDNEIKKTLSDRDKARKEFLRNFITLVERHKSIVLFPHVNPDGDCLGAVLGMKEVFQTNFPKKKIYAVGSDFGLFPWLHKEFDNPSPYSFDFADSMAVIVDVGTSARIQQFDKYFLNAKIKFNTIVKIDHHDMPSDFEIDLSWDDPTYAATCAQLVQIVDYYGWEMTPKAATFLYLGICTDSQRFLFDSVLPRTLILAAKTWRAGADHKKIHDNLGRRTWKSISVSNYILSNCNKENENVIWFYLTSEQMVKLGLRDGRGLINNFQSIEDFWIWMLFSDDENGNVKVDFRSEYVSVRDLAIKYGGGGHENASGTVIKRDMNIIKAIVKEADEIVQAKKDEIKRKMEEEQQEKERREQMLKEQEDAKRDAPELIKEAKDYISKFSDLDLEEERKEFEAEELKVENDKKKKKEKKKAKEEK